MAIIYYLVLGAAGKKRLRCRAPRWWWGDAGRGTGGPEGSPDPYPPTSGRASFDLYLGDLADEHNLLFQFLFLKIVLESITFL